MSHEHQDKVTKMIAKQAARHLHGVPVKKQKIGEDSDEFRLVFDFARPHFGMGYRVTKAGKLIYVKQKLRKTYEESLKAEK